MYTYIFDMHILYIYMSYILHAAKNEEFIKTEDMLACI